MFTWKFTRSRTASTILKKKKMKQLALLDILIKQGGIGAKIDCILKERNVELGDTALPRKKWYRWRW